MLPICSIRAEGVEEVVLGLEVDAHHDQNFARGVIFGERIFDAGLKRDAIIGAAMAA